MASSEKNSDEKWDAKFDAFKRDVMDLIGQQISQNNGSSSRQNYGHGQSGHGNQHRGQNNNYTRPRGGRRGRANWTGTGNTVNHGGNGNQNRGQVSSNNRGHRYGRSNSRGQSRGNHNSQVNSAPVPENKVVTPETEVENVTTNLRPEAVKKVFTNPLLPKDSHVSKVWTFEEAELFKGKFGTNAEQQYLKQYTNFTIDEAQSNANRCACELVLNCIPKFFGSYAANESHDLREATRILKEADQEFEGYEVVQAQRHPGQEGTDLDFIRVTVLFTNSQTPDRIATKAEKTRNTTMFQRSVPKNIRQRNDSMDVYITNLNFLRPKNCAYLWSTVLIRGEKHRIQRSDPSFVPIPEAEMNATSNQETEVSPSSSGDGLMGAIAAVKNANAKMAKTGPEAPLNNIPVLTVNEALAELKEKHGGNMELACQELLLNHGLPDKMALRKSRKGSSSLRA